MKSNFTTVCPIGPPPIHQTALPYNVETSDGMDVGFNPDTTVLPGESTTYRWFADNLGTHFFLDGANQAIDSGDAPPEKANLLSRGLFGSVSVFPQGTTWTDPYTGEERQGRVQVDIHVPKEVPQEAADQGFVPGVSFRQVLLHYHSPEGIVTADGGELTWPGTDEPQSTHAINYRADPTGSRISAPDVDDPELEDLKGACYNSWLYGDPAGGENAYPMYVGDPVRVGAIGASLEENHVHHLYGHRWKDVPSIKAGIPMSNTYRSNERSGFICWSRIRMPRFPRNMIPSPSTSASIRRTLLQSRRLRFLIRYSPSIRRAIFRIYEHRDS